MAQQLIQLGSSVNDGQGDPIRTAFTKVNENFTELYNSAPVAANLGNVKISGSIIGTVDNPDTGGWGGYYLYLDTNGESSSGIGLPNPTGQASGASLDIYHSNAASGPLRLLLNTGSWEFSQNNILTTPNNATIQQYTVSTNVSHATVNSALGNVIWTSREMWITSVKLLIQVEGNEDGSSGGWHTQTCEAIISGRANANDEPVMSVYGVVHTSTEPLVTFTVRRDPTTRLIEVVGSLTPTASGSKYLVVESKQIVTRD